jgi:alkylation response protein AidB-like acyl-CoA dehydrogenase
VNLQYEPSQTILRETAERFLSERYGYRVFSASSDSEAGFSADMWKEFASLGWLALPFSEDDGGLGGTAVDVALLMEAFGKALVIEPYVPTIILGGGLVAALGSQEQRAQFIPAIGEGTLKLAFAHDDRAPTRATKRGDGYVLSGSKTAVSGAQAADTLLVSAALPSGGTGVFALPRTSGGLTIRGYRTVDGARAADIEIVDVAVPASSLLGGNEQAQDAVAAVLDRTVAATCSDAVGAISVMVASTVDYAKTRVQFGQPIAKFQVLAHRMVDMRVREEEARASCLLATLGLDGSTPQGRSRAVSGAKAKIGRNGRFVAQNAIQTHGAIGTTQELPLGAYAKRLMAFEMQYGSTREHLRRYGALIADPEFASAGLLLEPAGA